MKQHRWTTRRGFMVIDVVIGFSVLTIIATAVTMAWHKQRKSLDILADRRESVRLAEGAIAALQTSQKESEAFVAANPDATVVFARVNDASAPEGFSWARVTVTLHEHEASLLGLVPRSRLTQGQLQEGK